MASDNVMTLHVDATEAVESLRKLEAGFAAVTGEWITGEADFAREHVSLPVWQYHVERALWALGGAAVGVLSVLAAL